MSQEENNWTFFSFIIATHLINLQNGKSNLKLEMKRKPRPTYSKKEETRIIVVDLHGDLCKLLALHKQLHYLQTVDFYNCFNNNTTFAYVVVVTIKVKVLYIESKLCANDLTYLKPTSSFILQFLTSEQKISSVTLSTSTLLNRYHFFKLKKTKQIIWVGLRFRVEFANF